MKGLASYLRLGIHGALKVWAGSQTVDALLGKSLGIADQQQSKPSHKNMC